MPVLADTPLHAADEPAELRLRPHLAAALPPHLLPVVAQLLEEVLGRHGEPALPLLREETAPQHAEVVLEGHCRRVLLAEQPDYHQLAVEVLRRTQHLHLLPFRQLHLVQVQDLSHEVARHLPGGVAMQEASHVGVEIGDQGRLQWTLLLLELLLLHLLQLRLHLEVLQVEVAQLPLQLLLHVQRPPELGVAVLELHLSLALPLPSPLPLPRFFLVEFAALAPEDTADLLRDHHERLKGLLESAGHSAQETCGEGVLLHVRSCLEQLLPDLVGSHVEPQADSPQRGGGGFYGRRGGQPALGTADEGVELGDELGVEGGALLRGLHGVDRRVVPQPELEQVEEDLLAREVGVVEERGLSSPVAAQLRADPLAEE